MKLSKFIAPAKVFKTLSHVKRLEILSLLQGHELTVNQIVQMTALRQATVSQHLMVLKSSHLVCTHKVGKEIYYSLCQGDLEQIADYLSHLTKVRGIELAEPTVIDPICLMSLTPSTSSYTHEYNGVRHYFCGKGCLKEFDHLHKGAI